MSKGPLGFSLPDDDEVTYDNNWSEESEIVPTYVERIGTFDDDDYSEGYA